MKAQIIGPAGKIADFTILLTEYVLTKINPANGHNQLKIPIRSEPISFGGRRPIPKVNLQGRQHPRDVDLELPELMRGRRSA